MGKSLPETNSDFVYSWTVEDIHSLVIAIHIFLAFLGCFFLYKRSSKKK